MISLIVAIAKNNVIGLNNQLPWHYKNDLKYFKEVTTNHKVVMGMKTFQSIIDRNGKILPNRENYVVTRNLKFNYPNVTVINDLKSFLKQNHQDEIFIIGGSQIFDIALDYADRLYITHINKEYDGDVFFPEVNFSEFKLISKRDEDELSFCVYERIK